MAARGKLIRSFQFLDRVSRYGDPGDALVQVGLMILMSGPKTGFRSSKRRPRSWEESKYQSLGLSKGAQSLVGNLLYIGTGR